MADDKITVNVPGIGAVGFPSTMTPAQITDAIGRMTTRPMDSMSATDIVGQSLLKSGGIGGENLAARGYQDMSGMSGGDLLKGAVAPTVGSTAGAVIGGRLGGYPGKLAGNAVGAAAGTGVNALMGQPSPTGSRLFDMLMAAGGALGGQMAGDAVSGTARVGSSPFRAAPAPNAGALRQTFDAVGVDPKVSDFSPNMAALERSVAQTPTGGNIIRDAANRQGLQLGRAKDEFLDSIAPAQAGERMVVGKKVGDSIVAQSKRTGALEDHLWTQIGHMANDVPVKIGGLKAMASQILMEQERRLPGQRNTALIAQAKEVLSHGDEVAWQRVDSWRKGFGEAVTSGELISKVPAGSAKALYRAALTDLEGAAGSADIPGLGDAYKNVRAFGERRRDILRDGQVAKVLETDPEQVVAMLSLKSGPTSIRNAREAIMGSGELGLAMPSAGDRQAWDYVRRHILEGVFADSTKGVNGLTHPVILGSQLDKALARIGKDGLKELLDPNELKALENLTTVAKTIRSSERIGAMAGTSATPQGMGFYNLIMGAPTALGAAAGAAIAGPWGAATAGPAAGAAAFILVPHVAARILTNPQAARVVASPAFAGLAAGANITAGAAREGTTALTRLIGILTAEYAGSQ